jgi:hypothetical protein
VRWAVSYIFIEKLTYATSRFYTPKTRTVQPEFERKHYFQEPTMTDVSQSIILIRDDLHLDFKPFLLLIDLEKILYASMKEIH